MLSTESMPESKQNRRGWFVTCRASWSNFVRKAGMSFWPCYFPSRSSQASRYPSVPIYALCGAGSCVRHLVHKFRNYNRFIIHSLRAQLNSFSIISLSFNILSNSVISSSSSHSFKAFKYLANISGVISLLYSSVMHTYLLALFRSHPFNSCEL